jgi:DNA-binding transcriptional LysR family regulator
MVEAMYLEALKIFCDVVRHRSFSKAAALNHISQSAASQNVLQLEKSLGVRLLDRSKRPFELTREGEAYYDGCRGIVERYYAIEEQVKTMRNEIAGTVLVAAIYSVGLSGMSRHVQRFARLYPQANIRLAYLHPDRVYESVLNEEADLGLISYPKAGKELVALPWREEMMVLACPPGHRLAGRSHVTGRDLSGERFVAFDESLTIRKEIDRQLRKHEVDIQIVMAFDNIETIKRAVELQEGVAILPEPAIQNETRAGTLVAVPLTSPTLIRPLGVIHRKSGELSRTARRFIELIQQNTNAESESMEAELVGAGADTGGGLSPGGGNGSHAGK